MTFPKTKFFQYALTELGIPSIIPIREDWAALGITLLTFREYESIFRDVNCQKAMIKSIWIWYNIFSECENNDAILELSRRIKFYTHDLPSDFLETFLIELPNLPEIDIQNNYPCFPKPIPMD